MNRHFNEFTDFELLELEVSTFCFVTGYVSACRDRRYIFILRLLEFLVDEIKNSRQTPTSEEIQVFQWKDLKSAEIIIDSKKSWKLMLDKGGGSLIKRLWRSGADLTKLDKNGKTMLHVAVEYGNKPVVMLLQSLGFNMKAKDSKGKTAWDFANEGSMISMKNLLWKYDIWES